MDDVRGDFLGFAYNVSSIFNLSCISYSWSIYSNLLTLNNDLKDHYSYVCARRSWFDYSPFLSSLPFEHLDQSHLFTRVCRLFVNRVTVYSILEPKQCPRCQVFLKSIQHLSLCNVVTSSD